MSHNSKERPSSEVDSAQNKIDAFHANVLKLKKKDVLIELPVRMSVIGEMLRLISLKLNM